MIELPGSSQSGSGGSEQEVAINSDGWVLSCSNAEATSEKMCVMTRLINGRPLRRQTRGRLAGVGDRAERSMQILTKELSFLLFWI
jgi:hypothetical protein